jgi:hypothetical protein
MKMMILVTIMNNIKIKNFIVIVAVAFLMNGCVRSTLSYTYREAGILEKIPNDEFKNYIQSDEYNSTYNLNNILYIDNINTEVQRTAPAIYLPGCVCSRKIVIGKNRLYIFKIANGKWGYEELTIENYKQRKLYIEYVMDFNNKRDFDISTRFIHSNTGKYCENKKYFKSCNQLEITFKLREGHHRYLPYTIETMIINHRYNDIYKIKKILDERIEYYKLHN